MRYDPDYRTKNAKYREATQVGCKVERSEYVAIRDEAARRGVSMRDLVYSWIEPHLVNLPVRSE